MGKRLKQAPGRVQDAYGRDPEAHRRMSSAGGRRAAEVRDNDRLYREWPGNPAPLTEAERDEQLRREQSGEDHVTPDNIG